jgi:hypothetical protein
MEYTKMKPKQESEGREEKHPKNSKPKDPYKTIPQNPETKSLECIII